MKLIVSSPAGGGKRTVLSRVIEADPSLHLAKSCTTKPPAVGEEDAYLHLTPAAFQAMVDADLFYECEPVHDNLYGTPKSEVLEDKDVIFEVDYKGAFKLKQTFPDARSVFLLVASPDVLEHRLRTRGREKTEEEIQRRLRVATQEIQQAERFDHWILNDNLNAAVGQFISLIAILRNPSKAGAATWRDRDLLRQVQAMFTEVSA